MKRIAAIYPLLLFLLLQQTFLEARMGKIFFDTGEWLKGDIQIQADGFGGEAVIMSLDSGSVITLPKSKVKTIIYAQEQPVQEQPVNDTRFHRALKNTQSHSAPSKLPTLYESYIRAASAKHLVDPELIKAVIKQESNFNRKDVSSKGAIGLMQLMPDTARGLGVEDAFDPWENIHGGTLYLRMMLEKFNGNLDKALAAYNAGPEAVKKYGQIPPYQETQNYVKRVMQYYRMFRGDALFAFEDKRGKRIITDKPFLP